MASLTFLPNFIPKVKEKERSQTAAERWFDYENDLSRRGLQLSRAPQPSFKKKPPFTFRWSFQSVLRLNASLSRTAWGVDSVCFGPVYFYTGWQKKREKPSLETHTHTHRNTTLIKCEDELDSGLVRGTLLMLIRGLGGYPSLRSKGGKSPCQARTWRRHFVSRLNTVAALYM